MPIYHDISQNIMFFMIYQNISPIYHDISGPKSTIYQIIYLDIVDFGPDISRYIHIYRDIS